MYTRHFPDAPVAVSGGLDVGFGARLEVFEWRLRDGDVALGTIETLYFQARQKSHIDAYNNYFGSNLKCVGASFDEPLELFVQLQSCGVGDHVLKLVIPEGRGAYLLIEKATTASMTVEFG